MTLYFGLKKLIFQWLDMMGNACKKQNEVVHLIRFFSFVVLLKEKCILILEMLEKKKKLLSY